MATISGNLSNLFDARINKSFFLYLDIWGREFGNWCRVQSSRHQYEKMALYGEVPMPDELGEDEAASETNFQDGPVRTWTHSKFGYKLIASSELLEDERFNVVARTAEAMGRGMTHRFNEEGAADLNDAFTVSTVGNSDTADETLCATTHATFTGAGGASQQNRPDTDVTLGVDSLWAGVESFAGLNDHEGNPARKIPKTLVIHPNNEREAMEILQSTNVPYSANNQTNAIRNKGINYVVGHYLDTAAAWFLVTEKKPIYFFIRRAPRIKSQENIAADNKEWVITARLSHAPLDWYDIYGTDGSA